MTPRAKKYRAKGDGITDDAVALQKWLDDGGGELDGRTYLSSKPLLFHNGCRIEGVHRNLSIIAAHPEFAVGEFLVNRDQARDTEPVCQGVLFRNFGIRGSSALRENSVALSLIGVAHSRFDGIGLSQFMWLITPANCHYLDFTGIKLSESGCQPRPEDVNNINCEGGTAFLGNSQWANTHFSLIDCHAHDMTWTAFDLGLDGSNTHWRIIRPRIERVHEAGFYGRLTLSELIDPTIIGVRKRAVSAHGFEGGLDRSEIVGGYISDTDACSLTMLNLHDCEIRGVGCFDANQSAEPDAPIVPDAAITIRSIETGSVHDVLIEECYGSDYNGRGSYPVGFFDQGGADGAKMRNVTVRRNHFGRGWKAGPKAVIEWGDVRGENFNIQP